MFTIYACIYIGTNECLDVDLDVVFVTEEGWLGGLDGTLRTLLEETVEEASAPLLLDVLDGVETLHLFIDNNKFTHIIPKIYQSSS